MVGNVKVIAVELAQYLVAISLALIFILLLAWGVWCLFIYYWLEPSWRAPIKIGFALAIVGGSYLWLKYRRLV
jgi:hypothetical protein